jgi:hypothetical protein
VAVQDVRGRGDSEGSFGGFAQEAADGAAAVRWCRSLEGANGRVGTYGFSYQGLSQLLNSGSDSDSDPARDGGSGSASDPLPDCLAPAMCGVDERLHWACEGGAHWWSLGLAWALQLAAEGCRRRGDHQGWQRIRRSLSSMGHLEEGLQLLTELDPGGMGLGWLLQDPAEARGWRLHAPAEALLRRPLLLIGGWHDPHLAGVLDLFARSRAAGGQPRLCIGAWSHLDWNGGLDRLQLAFFRRHLAAQGRGEPLECAAACTRETGGGLPSGSATRLPVGLGQGQQAIDPLRAQDPGPGPNKPSVPAMAMVPGGSGPPGSEPGPPLDANKTLLLQCTREGSWWSEADCDPQAQRGWELASEGLAAIRCDEGQLLPRAADGSGGRGSGARGSGGLSLVHDPWRPVPSRGGHLGPDPGPVERGDLDRRGDVACFQTPPLQAPLRLLGSPHLRIEAGADQPGFDLWATLSVVQANGGILQLCTGVRRSLGPPALELLELELAFQPVAAALRPGERLRLSLAAAAWPAIAVNPGDGSIPRGGSGPDHRVITVDLQLQAARLWLEPLIGAN